MKIRSGHVFNRNPAGSRNAELRLNKASEDVARKLKESLDRLTAKQASMPELNGTAGKLDITA